MSKILSREEKYLLLLLQAAIRKKKIKNTDIDCDWQKLLQLAESHAVSALLYDVIETQTAMPAHVTERIQKDAQAAVLSNYRLLFLTSYLTAYLGKHGIAAVTLKGAATASVYPVPEYRKSGDVDLLIPRQTDYERALDLLQQAGFQIGRQQLASHHVDLCNAEGITVELHNTLTEPFENQKINEYLKNLLPQYVKNIEKNTVWGVPLLQPSDAYHAFYLILHMLQHFMREGFGLKNLCDWTLFWDRDIAGAEKKRFLELVRESGTGQFVRVLTAACVRYLGLPKGKAAFVLTKPVRNDMVEAFLQEVLEAGEFGRSQADRMVAMRGTGPAAYLQEFQHQMHLNYPRAGRIAVCWPLLWGLTLARFLYNNRRLHRAPVRSILKKAGRRSALTEQMQLFQ